jgi:hypothetical protein
MWHELTFWHTFYWCIQTFPVASAVHMRRPGLERYAATTVSGAAAPSSSVVREPWEKQPPKEPDLRSFVPTFHDSRCVRVCVCVRVCEWLENDL